jgi:hypothetical protein
MKHIEQQFTLSRQPSAFVAKDMLDESEDKEQEKEADDGLEERLEHKMIEAYGDMFMKPSLRSKMRLQATAARRYCPSRWAL